MKPVDLACRVVVLPERKVLLKYAFDAWRVSLSTELTSWQEIIRHLFAWFFCLCTFFNDLGLKLRLTLCKQFDVPTHARHIIIPYFFGFRPEFLESVDCLFIDLLALILIVRKGKVRRAGSE